MAQIGRALLTVRECPNARRRDAKADEILPCGVGTAISQRQIILVGPSLVTMTFDDDGEAGQLSSDPLHIRTQGGSLVGADLEFVKIEINGLENSPLV